MTDNVKQVSGGATVVGERFEAPRPTYQVPQNADYMNVKEKDSTPAPSLVQKAKSEGNDKLSEMIAKAQASAKAAAERVAAQREGRKLPSTPRKSAKKESAPIVVQVGHFNPEDVCDDRTFIIRTRSSDIHTDEMRSLFWANGGEKFIKAGLGYAAAYTNLRTEKMKSIQKK
jgi:hypothetical protein